MRFRRLALLAALTPLFASAQTLLTFTGTAIDSNQGYTLGQQYTFIFETNSSSAVSGIQSSNNASWGGASMWTLVGGTGVLGTITTGSADNLTINGQFHYVSAVAGYNSGSNNGLTTLSGTPFQSIRANVTPSSVNPFIFPGSSASIDSTLSVLDGTTFTSADTFDTIFLQDGTGHSTTYIERFQSDTVTFSEASAVPEPSTAVALAGCAAIGGVLLFRRKRPATAA